MKTTRQTTIVVKKVEYLIQEVLWKRQKTIFVNGQKRTEESFEDVIRGFGLSMSQVKVQEPEGEEAKELAT